MAFHKRDGWGLYNLFADLLTAGVLIGIVALIVRRYLARPEDFAFPPNVPVQPEVRAGIFRDSSIVAVFIMFHVGCRLLYKAAELAQYGADPFHAGEFAICRYFFTAGSGRHRRF